VSGANKRQIDFYFDYISHNAYLAWHLLPAIATKYGYSVRPVPVLFAGFLQEFGQLGPAEIKPKILWMNRNNLRKATLLGIPLNPPKLHPFNPLFLLRLTAQEMPEHQRLQITERIFSAVWVEGIDPNNRDAVGKCLDDFDAVALIAGTTKDAVKAQVRTNTNEAIASGCFGVPSMVVNNEVFWGYDDLSNLEAVLADADPLDKIDHVKYHSGWEAAYAAGQHRQ